MKKENTKQNTKQTKQNKLANSNDIVTVQSTGQALTAKQTNKQISNIGDG